MLTNSTWMQENLDKLGERTLRQLCLPGTHDAGMGVFISGTTFASPCNTVTQTSLVLGQLQLGARYFDIRPVVSAGQYYSGHYTKLSLAGLSSWQGANGQSMRAIIDDINRFTCDNSELVILHLSHDLDTDVGNSKYIPFSQVQWNGLLSMMKESINNLKILETDDLTQQTLNDYIGDGKPAVIVIIEPSSESINIDNFLNSGFYLAKKFPVYNAYSDSNNVEKMITDQLEKMREQKSTPNSAYFLLSWTLTQSALQVTSCAAELSSSIIELANEANSVLTERLLPACNNNCFPNIIYIDAINQSMDVVSLAMEINKLAMREIQAPRTPPNPLILVHGRNAGPGVWGTLKSYLLTQGYTDDLLFSWSYDSSQSANEVLAGQFKTYVANILSQTGADKVDIVAHSLGSLVTRWFIKFKGGKDLVRRWISIAGPNHGTQLGWLCALWDQGCRDMTPGSYVITNLNKDTETPQPTKYTTIWSSDDEQISPPTSTLLTGADNIQVSRLKHNELLVSDEVFKHILISLATER